MTESQKKKNTGSTETSSKVDKEDSEARGLQREGVRAPACRKGTLKRGLKYTGKRYPCFYQRKFMEFYNKILGKTNFTLSECLVLPIMVLLAVVAYASLAAIFYNTDG